MTITLFLFLLTSFSIITGLAVEASKQIIGDKYKYSTNILAAIIAIIVGVIGTAIYYQFMDIAFTFNNIMSMFLMGIASAIGSMVGYDKIIQAINQLSIK